MSDYKWWRTNSESRKRHDDIWFVSPKVGWAVSSDGNIMHTADGGETWEIQKNVGTNIWCRCIGFSDHRNGWVGTVSSERRLFHTIDGQNWNEVDSEKLPDNPSAVCGIFVASRNVIYASGTQFPGKTAAIMKTTNNGETWQEIPMNNHANLLIDNYFLDELRGWVVGGVGGNQYKDLKPVVLYTDNGGVTWENQLADSGIEFPQGEWGWKIQFLDDKLGYISLENFNDAAILKTKDGGNNWERVVVADQQGNKNLEGVGFLNESVGWVGGWGDPRARKGYSSATTDSGMSWSDANSIGLFINRFRFTGDDDIVAYSSGDRIYRYSQNGVISAEVNELSPLIEPPEQIPDAQIESIDKLELTVKIPEGAKNFHIGIWARFPKLVAELVDENNPVPGDRKITWHFKDHTGADVGYGYFIYRITIDGIATSRLILREDSSDD